MIEKLPLEILIMILNHPVLEGFQGILRMVCSRWRQILHTKRITYRGDMFQTPEMIHFSLGFPNFNIPDWNMCSRAAKGGHLETLKWLRAQDPPFGWSEYTCSSAAKGGHLETLKWLRAEDPPCSWEWHTCSSAAKGGHLETLKWLRSQNPPCPYGPDTYSLAHGNGHLHILDWLEQDNYFYPS